MSSCVGSHLHQCQYLLTALQFVLPIYGVSRFCCRKLLVQLKYKIVTFICYVRPD